MFAGRLADAYALAAEPIPAATDLWSEVGLLARLAWVAELAGDEDEARAALARARELAEPLPPDHHLWGELGEVAALIELDCGDDAAAALDYVRDTLERLGTMQATSQAALCAVGVRAAAELAARARALRMDDEAEAAVREGRDLADRGRYLMPDSLGRSRRCLRCSPRRKRHLEGDSAKPWREALAALERVGRCPGMSPTRASGWPRGSRQREAPAAEVRAAITDAVERSEDGRDAPARSARIAALARARRVVPQPVGTR